VARRIEMKLSRRADTKAVPRSKAALDAGDRHASPTSNHPDRVEFVELFPANIIAVALASAVLRSAWWPRILGQAYARTTLRPRSPPAKLSAQRRGERPERDRKAIAVALAKPRPRAGVRFVPTMVCSAISERTRRPTAAAPLNLVIGGSLGPARPERPDLSVTQV
jgi:hypothetical protein